MEPEIAATPDVIPVDPMQKAHMERACIELHFLRQDHDRLNESITVLREEQSALDIETQRKRRALDADVRAQSEKFAVVQARLRMASSTLEGLKQALLSAAGIPNGDYANYLIELGPNLNVVQLRRKQEPAPAKES